MTAPARTHINPDAVAADVDPDAVCADVEYLLYRLGPSPDRVAATLGESGYTGAIGAPDGCPVARYLLDRDARLCTVAVGTDVIHLDLPTGVTVCAVVPDPVAEFITAFDRGDYPRLIASPLPSTPVDPGTPGGAKERS